MSDKTDDEKEAEEQKKRNLLWDGLEWLWDNLGSILLFGLLLVGAAYFIGPEKLGQWFGKDNVDGAMGAFNGLLDGAGNLFDKLKIEFARMTGMDVSDNLEAMPNDEFQKTLTDQGLSADAAAVLVKNKQAVLATIKAANGGKIQVDDFTNANSIFALMTKQPGVVLALLKTMPQGSPTGAMGKQIQASLKTIVSDDAKLGALLSPANRANTIAMLKAMYPLPIEGAELNRLIDRGLVRGQVSAPLRALITKATADYADDAARDAAIKAAVSEYMDKVGMKLSEQLAIAKDKIAASDPTAKKLLAELSDPAHPERAAKLDAFAAAIGPAQTAALKAQLMQGNIPINMLMTAATQNTKTATAAIEFAAALPTVQEHMPILPAMQTLIHTQQDVSGNFTPGVQQLFAAIQSNDPFGPTTTAAMATIITSQQMLKGPQAQDAQAAALTLVASIKPESVPEAQRDQFVKLQTFLGQSGRQAFAFLATQGPQQAQTIVNQLMQNPDGARDMFVGLMASQANNPQASAALMALVRSFDASLIDDPGQRAEFRQVQQALADHGTEILGALQRLNLSPEQAKAVSAALAKIDLNNHESMTDITRLMMQPEMIGKWPDMVKLAETLPMPTQVASIGITVPMATLKLPSEIHQLATLVQTVGLDSAGKPTAALTKLLAQIPVTGPLTADTLMTPPMVDALTQFALDPEVFAKITTAGAAQDALLALVAATDAKGTDSQREALATLKALTGPANPPQTLKLLNALGPDGVKQLLDALKSGNEDAMMKVVFKYKDAFKLFADNVSLDALSALPAKLQERLKKPLMQLRNKTAEQISALATIDERVGLTTLEKDFMQTDSSGALTQDANGQPIFDKDKLAGCAFDAKCRDDVKRAGIGHIAVVLANQDLKLGDTATIAQNLTALTAFGDALDANPANATAAGKGRVDTIRAALKTLVMTGSTDSLKSISADDINAFFGDRANADAFRHLMHDVDPAALSALGDAGKAGADLVRALQATYKNGKTGADELLAILADHESMAAIQGQLKEDTKPGWAEALLQHMTPAPVLRWVTDYYTPDVIKANADILPVLLQAIPKAATPQARS